MSRQATAARRGLPSVAGINAPSDRRFRRSDVRPDRRRRLRRFAVRAAIGAVAAVVIAAVCVWMAGVVIESSWLRVHNIRVQGNVRLSTGEIEALVDGLRGQSIFSVDFAEYQRRLMDSPWVADVRLARVLPSTIEIGVVERVPIAIARLRQQLYLVDDTGVIIDAYHAPYGRFDLPIVDGLVSTADGPGPPVDAERIYLVDRLLAALSARQDLRDRVSQIDVSNPRDAMVMFDDRPVWLHLGDQRFVERITTYLELAPALRDRFVDWDYVDLRFDERVFVRSRGRANNMERVR